MPQETGKQRAIRIPLDYFKRGDAIGRWKVGLTAVASILAAAWWAVGSVPGFRGDQKFSRGPLAAVHATWDANNCQTCHAEGTFVGHPMSGAPGPAHVLGDKHAVDRNCQGCHAGPAHNAAQKAEDVKSCGGCHRDHRGREIDLKRVADGDCTSCHANLPAHSTKQTGFHASITRFDRDHPEFAVLDVKKTPKGTGDPGKLKFNHALHTAPGLIAKAGADPYTFAKLSESDRKKYGWKGPSDDAKPIQLNCGSCHTLDPGDAPGASADGKTKWAAASRSAGDYMQPTSYDQHCKACHPLSDHKNRPVRHGLQPSELRANLEGAYAAEYFKGDREKLDRKPAVRPAPGGLTADERAVGEKIADELAKAEKFLFEGKANCNECHHLEAGAGGAASRVAQVRVPEVWFGHARFRHSAHRAVSCRECHPGADYFQDDDKKTPGPVASKESSDVLIAGVDSCKRCHAPATASTEKPGGARFDCVECHRYHNGDFPWQGRGAIARGPHDEKVRSALEFLINKK